MNTKRYEYDTTIHENERGGAYVAFPWNIREEFGKGRVKVHATFDGVPYDGSLVNMGIKDEKGDIVYIIGLLKSIRTRLEKGEGDTIHVVVESRE
ncbi:DUF1905 domain-containing protein [Dubosiella muris]|uniref:DUF1905 domain-containing protein n=1 Tax=Dubosiella muris TaxID=3038133 RepID=A0AC61R9Y0_9FIRM|nr:DUF1905 domain-containing protein [Dubosiella muris]TGY66907.1 DUF1905 domain-containing protein [Dubosiella muris]